jgi:hypothetical protein
MALSLINRLRVCQVYVLHIEHVIENVHYVQDLCQSRVCKVDHVYLTYLMLQRQFNHLNGRKFDRRHV